MASIFMYHAIGETVDIVGSDPHYAVSARNFEQQLIQIKKSVPLATQLRDNDEITGNCVTFDDGHLSNYLIAFPILKRLNMTSEFYINTAFVGQTNYMSWEQLKEMSQAGMSIQSHGHYHNYFSDLNEQDITEELIKSKQLIEENLEKEVTVFAPPGGRYDSRVVAIAKTLGYRCIANSIPGSITDSYAFLVPRFAVIHSTTAQRVKNWCNPWSIDSIKQQLRYRLFEMAKKALGNKNYDKLRSKLLNEEAKL
ncbi:MAG: polysaccharide deacetylase family protein [Kangiellaceae bacterium]|nr:polysaccharide deacetylase family protein [Kangiellaceae bacterium]